jgi:hypothetical protein
VGSTTDFGNLAGALRVKGLGTAKPEFVTTDVPADATGCQAVWQGVADHMFPTPVKGDARGWAALGVRLKSPPPYQKFGRVERDAVAANLDSFAREPRQAECIGLKAAAVEKGKAVSLSH